LIALVAGRAAAQCGGDCDGDGSVTVADIVTLINIALGTASVTTCPPGDTSNDGMITVDEILTAVNNALHGCGAAFCGNGIADAGEQCDGNDDAACPGRCASPAPVTYTCHSACGADLGPCSGSQDPACPGNCVTTDTQGCSCIPDNPPACPTPQQLPTNAGFACVNCVDIGSARLFYREEHVNGGLFLEKEIKFKNYVNPEHTMIAVTTTTRIGNNAPVVADEIINSAFPSTVGVNSNWVGLIFAYFTMVCGWSPGCDDAGHVLLSNGQQFTWAPAGGVIKYTYSCSGCGGGAGRVGTSWANARCGAQFGRPTFGLCRDSVGGTTCCGCPNDQACPDGAPNCVDNGCLP
jgi:hypothetical protein